MKRTSRWPLLGLLLLPVLQAGCKPYTIVKLNQDKSQEGVQVYFGNTKFKPVEYVEKVWTSKVIPFVEGKADEAADVIKAYQKDQDVAGEKYGIRSSSEGIPWNFIIKGKAKVLSVDTESMAGTMDVDLPPYDGKGDLKIQIGPVVRGTAIRDSLSFICFDDFENQIEFAQLANALNKKGVVSLQKDADVKRLGGKEINFVGCFAADGTEDVVVTLVELTAL